MERTISQSVAENTITNVEHRSIISLLLIVLLINTVDFTVTVVHKRKILTCGADVNVFYAINALIKAVKIKKST